MSIEADRRVESNKTFVIEVNPDAMQRIKDHSLGTIKYYARFASTKEETDTYFLSYVLDDEQRAHETMDFFNAFSDGLKLSSVSLIPIVRWERFRPKTVGIAVGWDLPGLKDIGTKRFEQVLTLLYPTASGEDLQGRKRIEKVLFKKRKAVRLVSSKG